MSATPPPLAVRLLARVLRDDPGGRAILGDLLEDFIGMSRARGPMAAHVWYWRETLLLSVGRLVSGPLTSETGSMRVPVVEFGGLLQDGRYALRTLRKSPGFALFTAGVMGLGVGAATSVFSALKPLVLAPLPFEKAGELVWIANQGDPGDNSLAAVSSRTANLRDFRERSRSFDGLTGYDAFFSESAYTLGGAEPERLVGAGVAQDFLDVLGVAPVHGRSFSVEEGVQDGPRPVILSYDFWRRRFGADPGIVGSVLTLNGAPYTVVGVLPPTFDFSSVFSPGVDVDFLLPFPVLGADQGGFQGNRIVILGRLHSGVSPEAAQGELDGILAALQKEQPERWGLGAKLTPLQAHISGPFRPALLLLVAAALTLLLMVCVNVCNIVLARSPGRAREVAVRNAMGASRGRIIRQLVLEMLMLSLAAAVLGAGLAWTATRLVTRSAVQIPLLNGARIDSSALLFATGVAVLTGLLVGLVPALQVAKRGVALVLREGGRGVSSGRGARRLRESLVVAEMALACVLLVVGGLLVRSFSAVLHVDIGFDPANAVAWQLSPTADFGSNRERTDFYQMLSDGVAAVPGVEEVGLIDALPLGRNRTWPLTVVGAADEADTTRLLMFPHVVDAGYLPAMGISLLAGRNFSRDDTGASRPVILMNESGAQRLFGGKGALGRRTRTFGRREWEVVGIVRDVRHSSPEEDAGIEIYFPISQVADFETLDLVVRSHLPVPLLASTVSSALRQADPSMATREFWTVQSTMDRALSARRFTIGILTAFAAAAILLAGLGIYGVLAQSVAERTHEIGIRMALGAAAHDVIWNVIGRTLALAGVGTLVGTVLSLWSSRLLESLLYGVSATDPVTFLGMILILLVIAVAAGAIPAARAARTQGICALRVE